MRHDRGASDAGVFSLAAPSQGDANAVARIVARIRRMERGNPGDTRSVGGGSWKCVSTTGLVIASTICLEGRQ